jgi:hypothetical protein
MTLSQYAAMLRHRIDMQMTINGFDEEEKSARWQEFFDLAAELQRQREEEG